MSDGTTYNAACSSSRCRGYLCKCVSGKLFAALLASREWREKALDCESNPAVKLLLDERAELRAVLSALGAVKGPEGWTVPRRCDLCGGPGTIPDICPDGRRGCLVAHFRKCPRCKGETRSHVPLAAPLTDKEEPR